MTNVDPIRSWVNAKRSGTMITVNDSGVLMPDGRFYRRQKYHTLVLHFRGTVIVSPGQPVLVDRVEHRPWSLLGFRRLLKHGKRRISYSDPIRFLIIGMSGPSTWVMVRGSSPNVEGEQHVAK